MTSGGAKGLFVIEIISQKHSTWQGNITWVARQETKAFRSLLELIKLINSGLEIGDWEIDSQ